jgi:hypothetical protein
MGKTKSRLPTRDEFYWFIRRVATDEDQDIGKLVGRHHGVMKGIIPASYSSGNPPVQQWWETSTTRGSKLHKTVQMYGNRYSAPAASDSIAIAADPDGNKGVIGKFINVGSAVVDSDYWMGMRPVIAGNTLLLSANTERSTSNTTFTTLKRFYVIRPGLYRIKFELSRDSGIAEARVYVPRDAEAWISSSVTENTVTYPTFSAQKTIDLTATVPMGTVIEIQLLQQTTGAVYIQNAGVYYADATAVMSLSDAVVTD